MNASLPDNPLLRYPLSLHVRPLSHQIFQGVNFIGISIKNLNNSESFQIVGKIFMVALYVLNTFVAAVEIAVVSPFALLSVSLLTFSFGKSEISRKINFQLKSYMLNVVMIIVHQLYIYYHPDFLRSHIENTACNSAIRRYCVMRLNYSANRAENFFTGDFDSFVEAVSQSQVQNIGVDEPYEVKKKTVIDYQENILKIVEEAITELYQKDNLTQLLSNEKDKDKAIKEGKEKIITFLVMSEVAHYAQLMELQNEDIICPDELAVDNTANLNDRSAKIRLARTLLMTLTDEEIILLKCKLLKTNEFDLHVQNLEKARIEIIQNLFRLITVLSFEMQKGSLLSEKLVNLVRLDSINERDRDNAYSVRHLFQIAYQKALARIN